MIAHVKPAVKEPFDRVMDVAPSMAESMPPQVFVGAGFVGGFITTFNPNSIRLSVNPIPLNGSAKFGFLMVIVIVDVPSRAILVGKNVFVVMGGSNTGRLAQNWGPSPPLPDVMVAQLILGFGVFVITLTLTVRVQLAPAGKIGMLNTSEVAPARGANVPPQEMVGVGTASTTIPKGKRSLKVAPPNVKLVRFPLGALVFGFVTKKEAVVIPFTPTLDGLNVLIKVGGTRTVMSPIAAAPDPKLEVTRLVMLCLKPVVVP